MARAYLSLGSNLGDRADNLRAAARLLAERGIRVRRASAVYETAPVGYIAQPAFFNAVLEVETALPPLALLDAAHAVEQEMGRRRDIHWGPRTLDIDLLLYDDCRMAAATLTLPHPRMHERRFVLIPLLDVAPECVIPGIGPARDCLAALDETEQPVRRVGPFPLPE